MKPSVRVPTPLFRLALLLCLLQPLGARAQSQQEDGGYSFPDGGMGGEVPNLPEDEDNLGRPGGACRSTADCTARFSCSQGRCRYTGIREAERVGCLLGPVDTLALVGVGLVMARRRREDE